MLSTIVAYLSTIVCGYFTYRMIIKMYYHVKSQQLKVILFGALIIVDMLAITIIKHIVELTLGPIL